MDKVQMVQAFLAEKYDEYHIDSYIEKLESFRYSRSLPMAHEYIPFISVVVYFVVLNSLSLFVRKFQDRLPVLKKIGSMSKILSIPYNTFMVINSLVTALLGIYGLYMRGREHPYLMLCETTGSDIKGILGLSCYMYYVTKYIEVTDTFFLAIRGKPLSWLHTYHHAVMFVVTWAFLDYQVFPLPWMVVLNSLIHVMMYLYYLLCDLKIRVSWKRFMTTAQIVQLCCAGIVVPSWFYVKKTHHCIGDARIVLAASAADVILISLFFNFYYQQYTRSKNAAAAAATKKPVSETKKEKKPVSEAKKEKKPAVPATPEKKTTKKGAKNAKGGKKTAKLD